MFTALIERPKMSEKLLIKPPFKYLFDIITETTKKTNFGNGNSAFTKDYMSDKNLTLTFTLIKIRR